MNSIKALRNYHKRMILTMNNKACKKNKINVAADAKIFPPTMFSFIFNDNRKKEKKRCNRDRLLR